MNWFINLVNKFTDYKMATVIISFLSNGDDSGAEQYFHGKIDGKLEISPDDFPLSKYLLDNK